MMSGASAGKPARPAHTPFRLPFLNGSIREFGPHELFSLLRAPVQTWTALALSLLCTTASAIGPDSLSIRDKAQINQMAAFQLQEYGNILNSISNLRTDSEGDAQDLAGLVEGISTGESRIFYNAESIIQDNVDPDVKPGVPGSDRKVSDYTYDFFMYFSAQSSQPVTVNLLERAEPAIGSDGLVTTKLLYEITFSGHHKEKTTPYSTQRRLMRFIAERRGTNDWDVYIAADDFFDMAKGFVAYQLEQQLKAAELSGRLTNNMRAYQDAEKRAAEEAERARQKKKQDYLEAMNQGDALMDNGEPEYAIAYYDRAGEIDPSSIDHIIRKKRARRAYVAKASSERRRALDSLTADLARQLDNREIKTVVVDDFTDPDGTRTSLGRDLAGEVKNYLTVRARRYKVLERKKADKAQAMIMGYFTRSDDGSDLVVLTTKIMNVKRAVQEGFAEREFRLPAEPVAADSSSANKPEPQPGPDDKSLPPPMGKDKRKPWAVGISAGLNFVSFSNNTDPSTENFTAASQGLRAGVDAELILNDNGRSRLASGVRFSVYRCTSTGEDKDRKFQATYAQVPILYRLYTGEMGLGRVGLQVGALAGMRMGNWTFAEGLFNDIYVGTSYISAQASPGICYESPAIGPLRITANASYDIWIDGFGGQNDPTFTTIEPKLNAISFALGVMF